MQEQTICLLEEQEMVTGPKDKVLLRHCCLLPFPSSSSSFFPSSSFALLASSLLLPLFSLPPLFLLVFALSSHTSGMLTWGGRGLDQCLMILPAIRHQAPQVAAAIGVPGAALVFEKAPNEDTPVWLPSRAGTWLWRWISVMGASHWWYSQWGMVRVYIAVAGHKKS